MTGFLYFHSLLQTRRLTAWTKTAAALLLGCLLIFPVPGQGAALLEDPTETAWNLSAGTVTYDRQADVYIAEKNVVITGGRTRLEADYVEFSNATRDVFAKGSVRLISGGDVITCNAMQINLITETGEIDNGTIFIQENHLYFHGEQIRKTGKFTYSAEKGSITSCDGDRPDWKITGKDVRVTIEGYGFARNTTLWAGNIPALYSPFLAFPVKTQRQTGLLMPEIASSDRLGFVYDQPFFWAISPSRDATFHAGILSDRGVRVGGEYRYVSDDASYGVWQMDYLSDDKIDDGTDATKDFRFDSTPIRTETDRYWLRAKSDQALPHGFSARLDLDVVSDPDYLLEFKDGLTGYEQTNELFAGQFGRDLDEYDDTVRKNSLILDRTWSRHQLSVSTLWYDNVTARQTGADDTTLQTLPGIEFNAVRQAIGSSGIYYALDSQLTSFFRQDTVAVADPFRTSAQVNGQRLDVTPTFYYPVKLGRALSFHPYAGVRGTAYHTDSFTDVHGDDDPFRFRGIYELGGDLSTRLDRVFTAATGFSDKIQHQVTPGLGYRFLPDVDQEDLPYFDDLDDLQETNQLTWSVVNRFTARKTVTGEDETPVNQYRELGWVRFFQDYDIKHERDGRDAEGRPWSDLEMDARVYPFSFLSLRTDLAWSPYTHHFTALNLNTTLTSPRGDSVTTAYRYTLDTAESWYTRLTVRISRELSAFYSFEKDLDRSQTIETRAGILLTKPCWALGLEMRESDLDRRIALMIALKGIGEFSTK
ncbi:MAG TPA: LPS assembly protein LptD [Desulfotignum sp.]|nr:LPS assembly protein LptD [Desulfotignum sp.]